jgi:hypothetical protein
MQNSPPASQEGRCVPHCGLGLLAIVHAGVLQREAAWVAPLELLDVHVCRSEDHKAVGVENAFKMLDSA